MIRVLLLFPCFVLSHILLQSKTSSVLQAKQAKSYCRTMELEAPTVDPVTLQYQFLSYGTCCPGRAELVVGPNATGPLLFEKIRKYILKEDDPIVIDIGANTGQWLESTAEKWPSMTYYGFEAFKGTVNILHDKFDRLKNPKIHFYHAAISNQTGQATLYEGIDEARPGSEHFTLATHDKDKVKKDFEEYRVWPSSQNKTAAIVNTFTIDDMVKREGITRIDLLKMDTEGSEPKIFEGAHHVLSTIRPAVIYFECHEYWRDNWSPPYSVKWASELLRNYGYDMFYVNDHDLVFTDEPFYSVLFDAYMNWRNCVAISYEAPGRDKFFDNKLGPPYVAPGLHRYLIRTDGCPSKPTAMPQSPKSDIVADLVSDIRQVKSLKEEMDAKGKLWHAKRYAGLLAAMANATSYTKWNISTEPWFFSTDLTVKKGEEQNFAKARARVEEEIVKVGAMFASEEDGCGPAVKLDGIEAAETDAFIQKLRAIGRGSR